MTKRSFIIILALLLTPILVFAQDGEAETEEIAYLRLNSNFSVPELISWDISTENETVLFSREDIQAQIYIRIVDTLNTAEAIDLAFADLELSLGDAVLEGSIGRNNGTWNYKLYSEGDMSITAYALLKSNQVYVVLFSEESTDYDAYHLAIRSANNDPSTAVEISEAINPVAIEVITLVLDADFSGEADSTRNPVADNARWIEASYSNDIMTASYLFDGIVYVTAVQGESDIAAELSDAFDTVFLGFVITPDNGEFLRLGLIFSAVIMLTLLGSMFLRYQNLKKDLLVIEQLAEEN